MEDGVHAVGEPRRKRLVILVIDKNNEKKNREGRQEGKRDVTQAK